MAHSEKWVETNWNQVGQGSKVAAWVRDLESSDSRIHKEKVIEKALVAANLGDGNAQTFLLCASATYNPFLTFNVKQVPETDGITGQSNPWYQFYLLMRSLHERSITGHDARDAIHNLSQAFDSDEWNYVARRTLIKDLRCGISEKTLNKVLAKTFFKVPVFECQLAKDSEDHASKMRGRARLEVKLDGVRVLAMVQGNSVVMYSRNGKVFDNFGHIEQELSAALPAIRSKIPFKDFVLDGEVIGNTFQELMRQARRKKNAKADDSVYYVFDIIPLDDFKSGHYNAQQHKRTAMLEKVMPSLKKGGKIQVMPGMEVDLDSADGRATMQNFATASINEGYEGIMIKNLDAPYECKRSTSWLKWKPTIAVDLEIVDCEEGTGKNKGRLGAFVCEGVDNGRKIRVNVGSGISDDDRTSYWSARRKLAGRVVEIMADAVTQNQDGTYSLRFPRFIRFRGFETHEKM